MDELLDLIIGGRSSISETGVFPKTETDSIRRDYKCSMTSNSHL